MCLIIYKPKGLAFNLDHILNGFENNPDGAGMMWPTDKGVHIERAFWTEDTLLEYLDDNPGLIDKDVVLHFRWATHGSMSERNCHPMPIVGRISHETSLDCQLGIAHNGIIGGMDTKSRSDTVAFIEDYLSKLKDKLFDPAIQSMIVGLTQSKFIIMSKDKLALLGDFIEEDGLYYSNDTYLPMTKAYGKSFSKVVSGKFDCIVCGADVDMTELYCKDCGPSDLAQSWSHQQEWERDELGARKQLATCAY